MIEIQPKHSNFIYKDLKFNRSFQISYKKIQNLVQTVKIQKKSILDRQNIQINFQFHLKLKKKQSSEELNLKKQNRNSLKKYSKKVKNISTLVHCSFKSFKQLYMTSFPLTKSHSRSADSPDCTAALEIISWKCKKHSTLYKLSHSTKSTGVCMVLLSLYKMLCSWVRSSALSLINIKCYIAIFMPLMRDIFSYKTKILIN